MFLPPPSPLMGKNPYSDLPKSAFWKTGVVQENPHAMEGIYKKKFDIPVDTISKCAVIIGENKSSKILIVWTSLLISTDLLPSADDINTFGTLLSIAVIM